MMLWLRRKRLPTSPFCTDKALSLQCPEFDFFNRFGQVLRYLKHHYLHCVRFEILFLLLWLEATMILFS